MNAAPFRTSRQCQDLLRYIVLHSMSGKDESLRERIIGVQVFGRLPDYDQSEDPVVRIRAADVRKRIALYYESTDVVERHLKISIPSGSYRASFEFIESSKHLTDRRAPEIVAPPLVESHPISPPVVIRSSAESRKSIRAWLMRYRIAALPIIAVLLLSIFYGLVQSTSKTAFERFWSPVLKNPNNSLIYVGSNAVYSLSEPFVEKYRQEHSLGKVEMMGREILVPLGPNDIVSGSDLIPIRDTYVTVGDVAATARIASFLSQRKRAYDMRFGGDISVGDLRERPAILIGAFNNSWTLGNDRQSAFCLRLWVPDSRPFRQSKKLEGGSEFHGRSELYRGLCNHLQNTQLQDRRNTDHCCRHWSGGHARRRRIPNESERYEFRHAPGA